MQDLIVVSRQVKDFGSVVGLVDDGRNDLVVYFRPEPPKFNLPDIDDVADQVELFGFG